MYSIDSARDHFTDTALEVEEELGVKRRSGRLENRDHFKRGASESGKQIVSRPDNPVARPYSDEGASTSARRTVSLPVEEDDITSSGKATTSNAAKRARTTRR